MYVSNEIENYNSSLKFLIFEPWNFIRCVSSSQNVILSPRRLLSIIILVEFFIHRYSGEELVFTGFHFRGIKFVTSGVGFLQKIFIMLCILLMHPFYISKYIKGKIYYKAIINLLYNNIIAKKIYTCY